VLCDFHLVCCVVMCCVAFMYIINVYCVMKHSRKLWTLVVRMPW
jgi:hypothetical protein